MRIICKDLTFIYNKKAKFSKTALNRINLTIEEGDFFGIIGHTGSGKSTFIQHLNGLIPLQEGELLVGEYDLSAKKKVLRKKLKELRSKVGMVFQYPEQQLFAESVYEDVAFGIKNFFPNYTEEQIKKSVEDALTTVGLNYKEIKNKSPMELSGGQKRRVAIAGVIVTKPEVLVLDEPVAGLDPKGKTELMELLHNLHKTTCKTIIIVSHDMNEVAENCNKVAVFNEGKIEYIGSPKEVFSNTQRLNELRLGVPDTAFVLEELKQKGVEINSGYTLEEFTKSILEEYKKIQK